MAQRRMFSMKIVDTDAFLDMPQSSQLLYYSLAMRADDDGFISNPKKIMRMLGSGDDDYKVLIGKKFIIPFESGVCVIKHWLIHNLIRTDRYSSTQYVKEMSKLIIDPKTKKYSYRENDVIPNGNQLATQDRLELGKDREEDTNVAKATTYPQDFDKFYTSFPARRKGGKRLPYAKWQKLSEEDKQLVLIDVPRRAHEHYDWMKDEGNYIPAPEVYLNKQQWLMPIVAKAVPKEDRSQKVDRFVKK